MTQNVKTQLKLTREEQAIVAGKKGETLQKVMKTVVAYGEALGAEKLVELQGNGHFVITYAIPGIAPSMAMLDELVANGLKTQYPFTLDPMPPLDYQNWFFDQDQIDLLEEMYSQQEEYTSQMVKLGLLSKKACTCTPYLPDVGSVPKEGDVLAWSESACAIFANSVLGARTNKNGAIIDLLCGIVGKTPLAGLLTDKGRKADWLIEIQTESLPLPQLLGAAIGSMVLDGVPYIRGLEPFLGQGLNDKTRDYLHEMGAACATAGAVALFHIDKITPEAVESGTALLQKSYSHQVIQETDLEKLLSSYPVLWEDKEAQPEKCFIGCPHLSFEQLDWWAGKIRESLEKNNREVISVKTTICAAPAVLERYSRESAEGSQLLEAGVRLSPGCAMQAFDNGISDNEAIVTNSNKLRAYTNARFIPDDELVEVIVSGKIK